MSQESLKPAPIRLNENPIAPDTDSVGFLRNNVKTAVTQEPGTRADDFAAKATEIDRELGLRSQDPKGKRVIVASSDTDAAAVERSGIRNVVSADEVKRWVDNDALEAEFGARITGDRQVFFAGTAVTANGVGDHSHVFITAAKYPGLVDWMGALAQENPTWQIQVNHATNQRQIRSQAAPLVASEQGASQRAFEAIRGGLNTTDSLIVSRHTLHSTPLSLGEKDLLQPLSAATMTEVQTIDVVGQKDIPLTGTEEQHIAMIIDAFQSGAFANKPIGELTPADYKELNLRIRKAADRLGIDPNKVGVVIPPLEVLQKAGLIRVPENKKLFFHRDGTSELTSPSWQPSQFGKLLEKASAGVDYLKQQGPLPSNFLGQLHDAVRTNGKKEEPASSSYDVVMEENVLYQNKPTSRAVYGTVTSDQLPPEYGQLFDIGTYNYAPDSPSLNLGSYDARSVRKQIDSLLKEGNYLAATAFVNEIGSLGGVLDYEREAMGDDPRRVIAADHQRSPDCTAIAQSKGVHVANFAENMAAVNWEKLVADGRIDKSVLDKNGLPIGLKGINTLNMIITIEKLRQDPSLAGMDINDDTIIMLTDADILNLGKGATKFSPEMRYDPFHYMGIALYDAARKGLDINSCHTSRTGEGRNNQGSHMGFDNWVNSPDPNIAKVGLAIARNIWPHTESRAYKLAVLENIPLFKDMQIEQIMDAYVAHLDVKSGVAKAVQVINPVPKIEVKPSPSYREWAMMLNLQKGVNEQKEAMERGILGLPADITIDQIAAYNNEFAMRGRFQSVTNDDKHSPRLPQTSISDTLLPSWKMLKDHGYIKGW